MYRLKTNQPDFSVVDGKFAGRKYARDKAYEEVPPQEAHRFEKVEVPPPPPKRIVVEGKGQVSPSVEKEGGSAK